MTKFYLLPIDQKGIHRGPAYLEWRMNPGGLRRRWSLKDFGNDVGIGLVATEGAITGDALEVTAVTGDLTRQEHGNITNYLQRAGVDSTWIHTGVSHRETLQRLMGLTQMHQAGGLDPTAWLGRNVHCGFVTLAPVDHRVFVAEQARKADRAIRPLVVRESFRSSAWRDYFSYLFRHPWLLPFVALPATDVFTGSNGTALTTYSASWTLNSGNFAINTNAITPNSSGNECAAGWNADTFDSDQYAQGTATATNNQNHAIGVACRCHTTASTATYYGWYSDTGTTNAAYLHKSATGTWTQLGSTGARWTDGLAIRLETNGTTIRPMRTGATDAIGSQTDSTIASGRAGLSGYSTGTNMRLDGWEGGNLGGAPAQMSHRSALIRSRAPIQYLRI